MTWIRVLGAWGLAVCLSGVAHAESATSYMQRFLQASSSVKAQFEQRVHLPSKNGQAPRMRQSSGTVEWLRPGKFRFDYRKPYVQTLVGNGRTVWFHDPDLAQVQVRQQEDLMRQSPLAWLIQTLPTTAQLQSWNARFVSGPSSGATQIQLDVPAGAQAPAQSFLLEFGPQGLQKIETTDAMGQRFEVLLSNWQSPVQHSERRFEFAIPAATEVVKL